MRLFENPGHGNDWINVKLTGVKTNRGAVGARITVSVETEGGQRRAIYRTVTTGGSFGASPLEQHVGLGKGAKAVDVEIYWPVSGTTQRFTRVPTNRVLQITELAADYTTTVRPIVPFGGAVRAGR
jgi:hypothetical protein